MRFPPRKRKFSLSCHDYQIIREYNLPDLLPIGNVFQAILYNKNNKRKRYPLDFENPRQKQALTYLQKNPLIKAKQYAKMTGVSHPTAVHDLKELVKQGKIKKIGKYRGTYYIPEKT